MEKLDTKTKERIEKRLKNLENNLIPSDSKFIGRDNNKSLGLNRFFQ